MANGSKPIKGAIGDGIAPIEASGNAGGKSIPGNDPAPGANSPNGTTASASGNEAPRDPNLDGGSIAPLKAKRGRKPGVTYPRLATTGTPENKLDLVRNDRAKLLNSIQALHQGAAILTGQQIFMLLPQEAKLLTDSLADVLDHYKINLSGPVGVWGGLFAAVGVIYGPRYFAFQQAQLAAKAGISPATPATSEEVLATSRKPMSFDADRRAA